MSTIEEKIKAQNGAFESPESACWHRDLIGPRELERLYQLEQQSERLLEALKELTKASSDAIYGSHGNAFLPGQIRRFTRAESVAKDILSNAKLRQPEGE